MDLSLVLELRDGVDIYYKKDEDIVFFIFLASRKRLSIKCLPSLVKCLPYFDGINTLQTVYNNYAEAIPLQQFVAFCEYLVSKTILIKTDWQNELACSFVYKEKISKQLDFLLDIVGETSKVIDIQKKIKSTKIAVMGLGAVGGWIIRELTMMGFQNFLLFDGDVQRKTDVARHEFFNSDNDNIPKVEIVKKHIHSLDSEAEITCHYDVFSIQTNLDFLADCDFIVNCMDEPYIGYTSIKLSRYCINNNKILFIAGGFDAHLASFGEIIIPFKTPCADCYATYFTQSLKNWQPLKREFIAHENQMGGLPTLSAFSASMGVLEILKFFIEPDWVVQGGRGEFLFRDYAIDSFSVNKDTNCKICSKNG